MRQSEHALQCAVFQWAAIAARQYPELRLLYAVPNAAQRSVRAARYMIAEGLRAGVPDVCLPVPRGTFGALYIEHKIGSAKPTDRQSFWIHALIDAGNRVIVSRSVEQSRAAIVDYLSLPPRDILPRLKAGDSSSANRAKHD